jgi:hypothetical protein
MKTIIDKRFDQLEPGDVLAFASHKQVVQLVELNGPGACRTVRCVVLGQVPIELPEWTEGSGTIFRVEIEQQPGMLTPAQQHADELLALVRAQVAKPQGPMGFEYDAQKLLDKIDPPQPVTLDEALAQLLALQHAQRASDEMHNVAALLDRARRTGALK